MVLHPLLSPNGIWSHELAYEVAAQGSFTANFGKGERGLQYYFGVDVSRDWLEAAGTGEGRTRRFPNTPGGHTHLCSWLMELAPTSAALQVVLEPTSTYHQSLVEHLAQQGIPFSLVNPARIASYAKAHGSRTKTDPKDARLLARYGERETPPPSPVPDTEQERLRALRRHREWVQDEIGKARNRLEAASHSPWTPESVRQSLERILQDLEEEAARIEKDLNAFITTTPRWQVGVRLLTTIPGVGRRSAVVLLSEMPPVERCRHGKQWVAYLGVDPQLHQSGESSWSHLSRVGPRRVRSRLYLAAISSLRWNPSIQALGERLKARGKRGRVRVLAAMNKLLRQCFAILQSGKPYDPTLYQRRTLDMQYGI